MGKNFRNFKKLKKRAQNLKNPNYFPRLPRVTSKRNSSRKRQNFQQL